jgi:hypothetical protein
MSSPAFAEQFEPTSQPNINCDGSRNESISAPFAYVGRLTLGK